MGYDPVKEILKRRYPEKIVYAPNYWQWFAHHRNHGLLPGEISHCKTQLELLKYLDVQVFSRNIYCNEQDCWFGGLSEVVLDGINADVDVSYNGNDKVIKKTYKTQYGEIDECLRYDFNQSTLIQENYLIRAENQYKALEELVSRRRWNFKKERYEDIQKKVGDNGVVMAGEVCSPLKLLHLTMGPIETVYFISDDREHAVSIMREHEIAQLDLVRQMAEAGVPAIASMDNLDTMFHTPPFVEDFCASFYENASRICHEHGSAFFVHACGNQKDNIKLIESLGVDGLEGVVYPPLGDIELEDVMKMTDDRFIVTGGISAVETGGLTTRKQVFDYVKNLFDRMRPYANRFMFSASCNTSIDTTWETILNFRDAWNEYSTL